MYIINPFMFYLMNLSEKLSIISGAISVMLLVGAIISLIEDNIKLCKIFIKAVIISVFIFIITPSEDTVKKMAIASIITVENTSLVKQEIINAIEFGVEKIKEVRK